MRNSQKSVFSQRVHTEAQRHREGREQGERDLGAEFDNQRKERLSVKTWGVRGARNLRACGEG